MKKVLIFGVIAVVVLIVAVVLVGAFKLGTVIKVAVEKAGPEFTGGKVSLESAFVRPFSGKASMTKLVVGNPDGYSTPTAFELGEIVIQLDVKSLAKDVVVIEEIRILNPAITYEKSLKKSNIAQILANVDKAAGTGGAEKKEESGGEQKAKSGKKVVISHVFVEGAEVRFSTALLMGKAVTLPLPRIEMRDLGKEKDGIAFAEAVREIINIVLSTITQVAASSGDVSLQAVKDAGEMALKAGEAAVGGAIDAGEAAVGGAIEAGGAALEGVKSVGAGGTEAIKDAGKAVGAGASKAVKGIGSFFGKGKSEDKSKEDSEDAGE